MSNTMSNTVNDYTIKVVDKWYKLIENNDKKIEGRLNKDKYKNFKCGDIIEIVNNDDNNDRIFRIISRIANYNTFEEYLINEKLENCLPTIDTIEDGINVYRQFYKNEDEQKYGIIAIELTNVNNFF